MSDDAPDGEAKKEAEAETQAAEAGPAAAETDVVLAVVKLRPDGRLMLTYSQGIGDMVAFLAASMDLLSGLLVSEHAKDVKRRQLDQVLGGRRQGERGDGPKILRVPAGARVKQ